MKTGIYKLVFSSGMTYIGKSVDIDRRLHQHAKALRDCVAADKLQREFEMCYRKMPAAYVVAEVHKDNLDVAEAHFIATADKSLLLNTVDMEDPFKGKKIPIKWLELSTLEMLTRLGAEEEFEYTSSDLEDHTRRMLEARKRSQAGYEERLRNSFWYKLLGF